MNMVYVAFGFFVGVIFTMAFAEYHGGMVNGGTKVYPSEQLCIIETNDYCDFTRIGVYVSKEIKE